MGLAVLDQALAEAQQACAAAQALGSVSTDRTAMALATRDLRYYSARRGSAQLVQHDGSPDQVLFGRWVTVEREDGRTQSVQIVGKDEADPAQSAISYISPLARAFLSKKVGDVVTVGEAEVEILAVEPVGQAISRVRLC